MKATAEYHKAMATHHARMQKLHQNHADASDDADPHAGFHRAAAAEHATMHDFHKGLAAFDELPEAENIQNRSSKAARWERSDIVPDLVHGAIPTNENWVKRSLEDRDLARVAAFGGPSEEQILVSRLEPELRKLVGGE